MVAELVAVVLLLVPCTSILGAGLGMGLMLGAILSHLGPLGIVVADDRGTLFAMAWIVLGACVAVLALRADQVRALLTALRPGANVQPH
ncbi:MAG: hypothetical protein GY711_15945 [bacterium]|nr:hypothetical protein [bacterium]